MLVNPKQCSSATPESLTTYVPSKTIVTSVATRAPERTYLDRPSPESPNTIEELMMQEADKVRTEIRKTLKEYQLAGGKFTVAYDGASAFRWARTATM